MRMGSGGDDVGARDGAGVGSRVEGATVGLEVGTLEGTALGLRVGKLEGAPVGLEVGMREGAAVGLEVGTLDGAAVGIEVGFCVGAAVGECVAGADEGSEGLSVSGALVNAGCASCGGVTDWERKDEEPSLPHFPVRHPVMITLRATSSTTINIATTIKRLDRFVVVDSLKSLAFVPLPPLSSTATSIVSP